MDALLLRDHLDTKKGRCFIQLDEQLARGSFKVGSCYLLDVYTRALFNVTWHTSFADMPMPNRHRTKHPSPATYVLLHSTAPEVRKHQKAVCPKSENTIKSKECPGNLGIKSFNITIVRGKDTFLNVSFKHVFGGLSFSSALQAHPGLKDKKGIELGKSNSMYLLMKLFGGAIKL